MPESALEFTATRIARLELKDEQQLVREGYELLDEKRILLAARIRRELAQLAALRQESLELTRELRSRTLAALGRHGLDELLVYPPLTLEDRLHLRRTRLFGLELLDAELETAAQPPAAAQQPLNPTPEARACAAAHRRWLFGAVKLAACCVNLRRLIADYLRTERRARAIENVLMPEIESALKIIDDQLEGMDQEEIARYRQRRNDGQR
ncbi:MAG: V-type ATP synthase subunit D [Steroidobacteraceae bacterium]